MFKKNLVFVIAFVVILAGFVSLARSQSGESQGKRTQAVVNAAVNAAAASDNEATAGAKGADDLYSQVELFSYALTTIMAEYVEPKKARDVIYGALTGMLSSLDPHSQFLTPEDYEELKTDTQGKFGGLGIEISIRDGLLTVVTPIEDTPAWKVGLRSADRIVKIEKELTRDMTLSQVVWSLYDTKVSNRYNNRSRIAAKSARDIPRRVVFHRLSVSTSRTAAGYGHRIGTRSGGNP